MTQYPSYTGPDEPIAATGPVGPAPKSTALAVRLMQVLAALSLVSLVVSLLSRDSLRTSIRQNQPTLNQDRLNTAVNVGTAFAVVLGIVFIVLYLLLANQVAKGKNWARIVTVVLAALSVLSTLSAIAQPSPAISKALAVLTALVNIALLVLLFRPDSRAFFAPSPTRG